MPYEVIMPKIAESIFEGTITKWVKKEGDKIEMNEPLFEISTDKVDTEIPAPAEGYLTKILHKEGAVVPINTVVAVIGDTPVAGSSQTSSAQTKSAAVSAQKTQTSKKPEQIPVKIESSQAVATQETEKVLATPLVRKIAKDEGINLAEVKGTGPAGRITSEDINNYIELRKQAKHTAEKLPETHPADKSTVIGTRQLQSTLPISGDNQANPYPLIITGEVAEEKMSTMRKKIAEHMVISRKTSAHVTTVWEVNLDAIVKLREKEKDYFERVHNTSLTYTTFFAVAAVQALREFPYCNCSLDGDKVILKKYVNLGIAVAIPEGLIVPVIRNADEKSFVRISKDIADLASRARSKKLSPDEVKGGTFTITNPGIYGCLFGTPIINQPEVAIMGVGGIEKRPVVRNDAIAIGNMVNLTLSFDHRVVDGAYADQFMAKVKSTLENWSTPIK
ncbi:MAG: 2-oxo acid dehydrogenase subunit E2 [Planctomycetes bacterium]|nr:2-oxo acid dehydrogenase subunit E2 [Planctomycetota bacterium]